jgi:hypothetical protein
MYIYIYYIIHIYACVNLCDLAHWEVHWRIDCRGVGVNWRPVDLSIAVPPNVSLKLLHQAAPGRLHHLCQIHRHIFASPIVCTVYIYIYIWLYIFYYIYLYIYLSLSLTLSLPDWLAGSLRLFDCRGFGVNWRPVAIFNCDAPISRVHQHTMIKVHDVVSYLYIYIDVYI